MGKKILALLMGTSLVLAACGGNEEGSETTDTAGAGDAAKLYENKCSACHGGDLVSGSAPDLDKIGSRLSQEDIEKVILEGKGPMPKGLLDENDAAKVAEWLAEKK